MSRVWVRMSETDTISTAGSLGSSTIAYQNSRETVTNITLVQKVTVVATHIMAVCDTEDTWSISLCVLEENATAPIYNTPERNDPLVKGMYYVSRGPVYFSPRRLISIPSEHSLYLRINKELGGSQSTINVHAQFLLQMSF